jgi:Nucleotidyl transferase AbiEii toxin, Type IV TA system
MKPQLPYQAAEAMRTAVLARAKQAAQTNPQGLSVSELLRQFAYDRLLARLFTAEPEGWVLKGATGLLARIPTSRHSRDVDLWRPASSLQEAEQALEAAAQLDLGDYVVLRVGLWEERPARGSARPVARTLVACRLARRPLVSFPLDLVGGPPPPLPPEPAPPLQPIALPGLPEPARILLYPVVSIAAEKLAAIDGLYGQRLDRPSSRYRDLADLALIALTQTLAAEQLHVAVAHEFARRDLPVPEELVVPDPGRWAAAYAALARGLPDLRHVGFEEAVKLVKDLVDPVLDGRRTGWWDPHRGNWRTHLAGGR